MKLFRIVGWKRLETNRLLELSDVTEHNFESIHRRICIIKIQSRFVDSMPPDMIEEYASIGIFKREYELWAKLTSRPAQGAFHYLQSLFEDKFSKDDCYKLLRTYHRGAVSYTHLTLPTKA